MEIERSCELLEKIRKITTCLAQHDCESCRSHCTYNQGHYCVNLSSGDEYLYQIRALYILQSQGVLAEGEFEQLFYLIDVSEPTNPDEF
jgi:hypothetical protein